MDFCSNCGEKTDPDWVFCRACGAGLDLPEVSMPPVPLTLDGSTAPKVELISRDWDVVEIEAHPTPEDPLEDEPQGPPLPPGAVEISVADIAVVETPGDQPSSSPDQPLEAPAEDETDRWDHLRPHGEVPPLMEPSKVAARTAQLTVLCFALVVLAASMLRFYLNTVIDGFADARVSAGRLADVERLADIGLLVAAGFAAVAVGTTVWWLVRRDRRKALQFGASDIVALLAGLGGAVLIGLSLMMSRESVAEALTANSVMVMALGLVMVASLAVVRTIGRVEDGAAT